MVDEVVHASEYHGVSELRGNAIEAAGEAGRNAIRPFLNQVRTYMNPQKNNVDSYIAIGNLKAMVEGRNAYLAAHAGEGVVVDAPAQPADKRGGTWADVARAGGTAHVGYAASEPSNTTSVEHISATHRADGTLIR